MSWKHEHSEAEYVIFESATILEKPGLKGIGDVTVLIDAPVDARVERAALRDGADAGKVRSRMAAQSMMNAISDGLAESPTDFVVMNGSSEEDFHDKLYDLAEKIIKHFC